MRALVVACLLVAAPAGRAQEDGGVLDDGGLVAGGGATIERISVRVDRPVDDEEGQLLRYLGELRGWPAAEATAKEAEERVLRLGRYQNAVCRTTTTKGEGRLKCGVVRSRIIRNIRFEGLPAQVLETDIRKRLFLRPGEALAKDDAAGRDRITRQRQRLEEYLEREGFYGAQVELRTPPVSTTADVEVVVRIKGGGFVRVRDVDVSAPLPFSKGALEGRFGAMCADPGGWLTFLETWQLRCYTRGRVRDVVDDLEEELRERGFVEGRVVVETSFVDPTDPAGGSCAFSPDERAEREQRRERIPPRCVDLHVSVEAGRRLVPNLVVHRPGQPDEQLGRHDAGEAAVYWVGDRVRNILFVEEVSRGLQLLTESPLVDARDTRLRLRDLYAQLTFASSGALDDTEAELSRQALLTFLATRGYLGARVDVTRVEEADRVDVRFDVWPGVPSAVNRVLLVGNARFSDEELEESIDFATRPRSLTATGFITKAELEDDRKRLLALYEERGYRDASVDVQASPLGDDLLVSFRIVEGEPYLIAGVKLVGGHPALSAAVLSSMVHCKGGAASQAGRPPLVAADCAGAALRPDEIEAEEQRIVNVYARAGFPYVRAHVQLSPQWTELGPFLDVIVWEPDDPDDDVPPAGLDPGRRPVRVSRGEIFLEGDFRTDKGAVLKELGLREGPEERLDPIEISEGVSRLRRTGLFSRVGYEYVGREDRRDQLDVVVHVEERKAGTVDAAVAFSTEDLLQLRSEWRDRNLFGLMLDFGVQGDLGLFVGRRSQLLAPFRWPRILGSNFSLRVEPSAIYSDHPSTAVPRSPADTDRVSSVAVFHALTRRRIFSAGGKVGVEWQSPPSLVPGLSAGLDYELRAVWDDPAASRIPLVQPVGAGPFDVWLPAPRALTTLDGLLTVFDQPLTRFGVLSPAVRYNNVVNPFDPEGGFAGELGFTFGSPYLGGSETTLLVTTRATYYWPVTGDVLVALHGRAWGGVSIVDPGGRSLLLRPELISLGGDRTVRGYSSEEPFGVAHLAAEIAESERATFIGLAGALGSTELRYTLVRNLFVGDLKLAAFVDAGLVTDDLQGLPWLTPEPPYLNPGGVLFTLALADAQGATERLGVGTGVGVRYVLPVGPLSFDVAFAPLRREVTYHLQFGYSF